MQTQKTLEEWEKEFNVLISPLGYIDPWKAKEFIKERLFLAREEWEEREYNLFGIFHGTLESIYGKEVADILFDEVKLKYEICCPKESGREKK